MTHSIELLNQGPHFETGEPLSIFRTIVVCHCRRRRVEFAVPTGTRRHATACVFCGDMATLDLARARNARGQRKPPTDAFQETRCRHEDCGKRFYFDFATTGPECLDVVCPTCATVKRMRRRSQAA